MPRSSPVDGFRIAYDRESSGPPVVLLHGGPGGRADYREVTPLLSGSAEVVVPDLRGFRESDEHPEHPARAYSAEAQARSVVGLIDELGLQSPVIAGAGRVHRIDRLVPRRFGNGRHEPRRDLTGTGRPNRRPATKLDPLFPQSWSDRLGDFFSDATLEALPSVGHFYPLEAPQEFASAIRDALNTGQTRN
jgi:pimeloyl-ACP methyl ester carboxylesterase